MHIKNNYLDHDSKFIVLNTRHNNPLYNFDACRVVPYIDANGTIYV